MASAPEEAKTADSTEAGQTKTSWKDKAKAMANKGKEMAQVGMVVGKAAAKDLHAQAKARLSMEGLLGQARESLEKFLNPDLDVEKQIPREVLKNAKGVVFLTVVKAGLGLGGEAGSGVIIVKTAKGNWSAPCAIGAGGVKWGLQIGASKVDYIMVLWDKDSVDTFTGEGQIKVGADANVTVGPKGRDADVAVAASKTGIAPILSYSMSKGAYLGITLKAEVLLVRNDCNEAFYGRKVKPTEVLRDEVELPQNSDHSAISAIMDCYTSGKPLPKKQSGEGIQEGPPQ